ncbi:MAG: IS607 family transposase [Lactococcus garvieae]
MFNLYAMKLSGYAKKIGITYRTAWDMFHAGQIEGAYRLPTGTIIIPEGTDEKRTDFVAVYARVSSSENKGNLKNQSQRVQDFCAAKGWTVNMVVEECASGLNDKRPKLAALLKDRRVTKIVVEHKDRLTRFGFNYISALWDGEIVVVNEVVEDEKDLMQDFVSLVTCFTARLYGLRRSKRATEKLIKELSNGA